ncbi:MAG TPA: hypothetical protein VGV57_13430 [Thermoleophilaceae bacterium]|nr:hypothetical protein [Thermoleophilaceae bacterium]
MTDPDPATRTVAPTLSHLAVPIASLRPHPRPRHPRRGDLEHDRTATGRPRFSDLPGA